MGPVQGYALALITDALSRQLQLACSALFRGRGGSKTLMPHLTNAPSGWAARQEQNEIRGREIGLVSWPGAGWTHEFQKRETKKEKIGALAVKGIDDSGTSHTNKGQGSGLG